MSRRSRDTQATSKETGHATRRVLGACLFFSGAASLVMEVAWSRALSLVLGNSHQAVATVVASMMTGLFLGSLLAARFLQRIRHLPRAYGLLEIGIGLYGALTPLIFKLVALFLGPLYSLPSGAFLFLRFLLVFGILLPPSAGMGATLPVVTAAVSAGFPGKPRDSGSVGGWLYGINTLGAFLGTLAGGFLLLPGLGLLKATLTGAGTSLAVGTLVWLLSGSFLRQERAPATPAEKPAQELGMPIILPLYAASGFIALVYEITWTRVLAPVAGSSVYSFTLILAAILAGIGAGSLILSTRIGRWIHPGRGFVAGQILLGGVAFGSLWGLKFYPQLILKVALEHPSDAQAFLLREFLTFGAIVLPPGILLGALFPFASRLLQSLEAESGADVGKVYAWNTAGSLLGSLAAGFFLVETIGSEKTLALACIASVSLGLAGLVLAPGRLFRPVAASLALLLALIIPIFPPTWDLYRMTTGVTQLLRNIREMGPGGRPEALSALSKAPDVHIMFHKEGKTSTVTVIREWFDRWLRVDGKTDASTLSTEMQTQVLLGQTPMFFAPHAQDICVIGYGSGVTANAVLTHPIRRVDIVEIEQQVIAASPLFEVVNHRPLSDPRHHLIIDDARTALAYRPQQYDVVISEPSNPWMAGVNNLFTAEFYRLVRKRLKPGGVFCQWLQSYELSDDSMQTIMNTVASSFPYTHLFASHMEADTFILGSDRPLKLEPEAVQLFPDRPRVREDLARVGITQLSDLAILYTSPLQKPAAGTLLNTDDNSLIQYRAPLEMLKGEEPRRAFIVASPADVESLFFPGLSEVDALTELGRACHRRGALATLRFLAETLRGKGATAQADELQGRAGELLARLERGERVNASLTAAEAKVGAMDREGAAAALKDAEVEGLQTAEEWTRAGMVLMTAGRYEEAEAYLSRGVEMDDPRYVYQGLSARGACRYRLGRLQEGRSDIEEAKRRDPEGSLAYIMFAGALFDRGQKAEAVQEIEAGMRIAPDDLRLDQSIAYFNSARPPTPPPTASEPTPPVTR
jgi:spermidine synthase